MTIDTPTTKPRKNTKKKIAALLLALLLLVAGYLFFTQPVPIPAPKPEVENPAQAEWFAVLAELKALPAPTLVCPADEDNALGTFVFRESLPAILAETSEYEQCVLMINGGFTLDENGEYVYDEAKVEAELNALGYTYNWTALSVLPPAPDGLRISMDENAADTFRSELGELEYFAGESTTDADGTVHTVAPETLGAPFQDVDGLTAKETAQIHDKVSDADYRLLTQYASQVLEDAPIK